MAILIRCECGREARAKDSFAGKTVTCPACGQMIEIPTIAARVGNQSTNRPARSKGANIWSRGTPKKIAVYGNDVMPDDEFLKFAIIAIIGLKLVPNDELENIPLMEIQANGRSSRDGFHLGIARHGQQMFPSTRSEEVLVIPEEGVPGGLIGLVPIYDD